MYNNRLRRWHRYPFVSVRGHLGFPSAAYQRRGPREGIRAVAARRAGGDKMAGARRSESYGRDERIERDERKREREDDEGTEYV